MSKLRVLVVEDSKTVRARILEVLSADPDIEIAGEAQDGKRAIELCRELRPDVVTLDMMLPVMTGLAATEYIMAHFPTPILIVSASINRGELFRTYDALAAGAVDVLEKPTGDEAAGVWETKFIAAVKLVARIKVITHPRARLGMFARRPVADTGDVLTRAAQRPTVVAIGASTGGPGAIVDVLRTMPADFPTPILLVLHIGEPFGTAFADWLDGQSNHRVAYARDGEPLASVTGRVAMAPPNKHLRVRDRALWLTSEPERHSCRPSVDILFESVAAELGAASAACLLTGMGRDGAAGLLEIRRRGGFTIAQDEATCVVYGMPREAVLLGAAERVLPLAEIGPALSTFVGVASDRRTS
jgi:two-component system, chemotaxis family, protein-glutamate methylesterase/glutaminase